MLKVVIFWSRFIYTCIYISAAENVLFSCCLGEWYCSLCLLKLIQVIRSHLLKCVITLQKSFVNILLCKCRQQEALQLIALKLCTVISTLMWAVLAVLWIGFCHTGPISLCRDSFVFMFVYFVYFSYCMKKGPCCVIVTRWCGPGGIEA